MKKVPEFNNNWENFLHKQVKHKKMNFFPPNLAENPKKGQLLAFISEKKGPIKAGKPNEFGYLMGRSDGLPLKL